MVLGPVGGIIGGVGNIVAGAAGYVGNTAYDVATSLSGGLGRAGGASVAGRTPLTAVSNVGRSVEAGARRRAGLPLQDRSLDADIGSIIPAVAATEPADTTAAQTPFQQWLASRIGAGDGAAGGTGRDLSGFDGITSSVRSRLAQQLTDIDTDRQAALLGLALQDQEVARRTERFDVAQRNRAAALQDLIGQPVSPGALAGFGADEARFREQGERQASQRMSDIGLIADLGGLRASNLTAYQGAQRSLIDTEFAAAEAAARRQAADAEIAVATQRAQASAAETGSVGLGGLAEELQLERLFNEVRGGSATTEGEFVAHWRDNILPSLIPNTGLRYVDNTPTPLGQVIGYAQRNGSYGLQDYVESILTLAQDDVLRTPVGTPLRDEKQRKYDDLARWSAIAVPTISGAATTAAPTEQPPAATTTATAANNYGSVVPL